MLCTLCVTNIEREDSLETRETRQADMVAQHRRVSVRWAMVLLGLLELGVKAQGGASVTINTDDRPPATVREGSPKLGALPGLAASLGGMG